MPLNWNPHSSRAKFAVAHGGIEKHRVTLGGQAIRIEQRAGVKKTSGPSLAGTIKPKFFDAL